MAEKQLRKGKINSEMVKISSYAVESSKIKGVEEKSDFNVKDSRWGVYSIKVNEGYSSIDKLHVLRKNTGPTQTHGLPDVIVNHILSKGDVNLRHAIDEAIQNFLKISKEYPILLTMDERTAIRTVQSGYLNFYEADNVNPFLPLAAKGPWIVTLHGTVIHDSGGYGMLGFGQNPEEVIQVLAQPHQVMANIMTANISQMRFLRSLHNEIGHTRSAKCPYARFVCMNSGSEAMSVASRISDAHARRQVDSNGRHAGKRCVHLALKRGFHGRTYVPASFSDSSHSIYQQYLASFKRLEDRLWTVQVNDIKALKECFNLATKKKVFIESFIMEPVQGEGSPGMLVERKFYDEARRLTLENDSLLIVDSIQAGLRAYGTLSIVDYPGFEDCDPPDMETWSKALNGGQFPLSLLGLTDRAADEYVIGLYGNTMTTNPRALDVACAVLSMVTPALRKNIRNQGKEFVRELYRLQKEKFPELITEVHGTGLLFCVELNPQYINVVGANGAEERCRLRGMNVIHGGKNAIRFTPHFRITNEERKLMMGILEDVLAEIHGEFQI